jgi:hypothetical protein
MDLAEARLSRVCGGRIGRAVRNIELQGEHPVWAAHFRLGGGQMVIPYIGNDDIHASAQKRFGDAKTNAARAAGNKSGFSG